EPAGSTWHHEDGSPMHDNPADSTAVGSRALIKDADQPDTHPDVREFALAIADFALLYDPRLSTTSHDKGLDALIHASASARDVVTHADRNRLDAHRAEIRRTAGLPVDPPPLPEAISTEHHNPYVVNYSGAPLPLRIGQQSSNAHHIDCARLHSGQAIDLIPRPANDISRQRTGIEGDLSWAFAAL